MPHCPCDHQQHSVPEMAECAAKRLRWGLVALVVLSAVPVVACGGFNIPAIIGFLVFAVIVIAGLRGVATRNKRLLKFYWIVQFISLIVTLVALLVSLGGLVYMLVHHRSTVQTVLPLGVVEPVKDNNAEPIKDVHAAVDDLPKAPEKEVPQMHGQLPKPAVATSARLSVYTWVMLGVAVLWFIVTVTVKVRTIILARQLVGYIETMESDAACDTELQPVSDDVLKPAPSHQPAVFVVPQVFVGDASAGQLLPVYVAKK